MSLFGRLFNEFIDVIEWTDDSSNTMVYRFERYGNEIKYGAKLIVRESQFAVFVNEGEVADVLGPGTYALETRNLPVLTTLQNWRHGFQSPFKAEVYFCNARRFVDLKWGTRHPLMLRDAEFGGLRIRAFGTYGVRIVEPLKFIREIVGTEGVFTTEEISAQLRNLITSRFATIIGSTDIPILDLAANYDQLGEFLTLRIAPEFAEYGLELTRILVENISLPPSVSEALDKRTSMGMTGNLDRYLRYQTGVSMEAAAANPGGGANEGIGMGIGLAMANRMNESLSPGNASASASADPALPPPLPGGAASYHVAIDKVVQGPFGPDALRQQVREGKIDDDTLVWTQGMSEWQSAAEVDALRPILEGARQAPPPLPGR
ncbi:MAG: antifreeze protein [Gammaproteobacteria bacterium]|nr:MAG: antifreeze protein [Gammaproteobacteria bacterium]